MSKDSLADFSRKELRKDFMAMLPMDHATSVGVHTHSLCPKCGYNGTPNVTYRHASRSYLLECIGCGYPLQIITNSEIRHEKMRGINPFVAIHNSLPSADEYARRLMEVANAVPDESILKGLGMAPSDDDTPDRNDLKGTDDKDEDDNNLSLCSKNLWR